jgi:hypothetical protein
VSPKPDLDSRVDRLYAADPDEFVAGRDELAKELRADGRSDDAKAVKGLRKPSRPAALVNWLALERAKDVDALAKVAARLRDPKTARDGAKLRKAVAEQRDAVEALVGKAREEAERRGAPAAALERVEETLRAMASDPEVEEVVRAGRLDREREASTIGFAPGAGVSKPAPGKKAKSKPAKGKAAKPKGPTRAELKKELTAAKRAAGKADAAADRAQARLEEAEAELNAANSGLREAKAEAKRAREEARAAQRRFDAA